MVARPGGGGIGGVTPPPPQSSKISFFCSTKSGNFLPFDTKNYVTPPKNRKFRLFNQKNVATPPQCWLTRATTDRNPIEIFIPRDPSLLIPPMILNNVTLIDDHRLFHFHLININQLSTNKHFSLSLHFQIRPININISYLFIYKFDIPFMLDTVSLKKKMVFCRTIFGSVPRVEPFYSSVS